MRIEGERFEILNDLETIYIDIASLDIFNNIISQSASHSLNL